MVASVAILLDLQNLAAASTVSGISDNNGAAVLATHYLRRACLLAARIDTASRERGGEVIREQRTSPT